MFSFLSFCLVLFFLFLVSGVSHASVFIYMYVSSYYVIIVLCFSSLNFSVILVTLLDLIVQLCSWYIFCTVDVGGLSLGVVGYSVGFFVCLILCLHLPS